MWFHSWGGWTEETGGILEPLLEQEVAFPPVSLSSVAVLPLQRNSVSHRIHFLHN